MVKRGIFKLVTVDLAGGLISSELNELRQQAEQCGRSLEEQVMVILLDYQQNQSDSDVIRPSTDDCSDEQ